MKADFLIIGLGNYPDNYIHTKHNVGKDFLLFLYEEKMYTDNKLYKCYEEIRDGFSVKYIIAKTYMNNTGEILLKSNLKEVYKNNSNIQTIIIHDDLELSFGKCKLRNEPARGERGHNGIRSYNNALKEILPEWKKPFYYSVGIGRSEIIPVSTWVLQKFDKNEITELNTVIFPQIKKDFKEKLKLILD